jgi:hypothetical protein
MTRMRGEDRGPETMFSYVSAEQRVPKEHPLRAIRALVDDVLRDMSREFDGLYPHVGRPSIPPERLSERSCFRSSIRSSGLHASVAILHPDDASRRLESTKDAKIL